jgi:hypothetical protein
MSSGGAIGLEIRGLAMLIKSIIDLGLEYKELKSMRTADGKIHNVDLVIKDEFGKDVGFEKTEKGDYRIIADTSGLTNAQLKKQQDFIKKIRQRYSYNNVINELKKQGYIIAEEEKVQNNTIRLVARKWS